MRGVGRRIALALGGTVGALLLIELAVRIATGFPLTLAGPEGGSFVDVDPELGRIPKPGLVIAMPEGFSISTAEHGTRPTRTSPPPPERPLILAVGDSFAFGDDVNDDESWPAALEQRIGRRVINAGVPGFGLDQAVLRAERLADAYRPDTIVVAFIPHDVKRCEMSYWSGHPKPYFEVDGNSLRLQPSPIPPRPFYYPLMWLLSFSVALDRLFPTTFHWEGPEVVLAHDRGGEVACRLMERLAVYGRTRNARIVVLAHPQDSALSAEDRALSEGALACARANGLRAVDLFPVFEGLATEQRESLFDGHLTPEGNRLIAAHLAQALEQPERR